MNEPSRDNQRLQHILSAIDIIETNKGRFTLETLQADIISYYGFVKQVEIIGEAVYKLSKEFKTLHPEVDWDSIEGMRHVLVHGYYQIKPNQLWRTIQYDIPSLKPQIEALMR